MCEQSSQNYEQVRFVDSLKLLGGVLGPFCPPGVPQGREVCRKGIVVSLSKDQVGAHNSYFSIFLMFNDSSCIFDTFPGSVFESIVSHFAVVFRSFLNTFS